MFARFLLTVIMILLAASFLAHFAFPAPTPAAVIGDWQATFVPNDRDDGVWGSLKGFRFYSNGRLQPLGPPFRGFPFRWQTWFIFNGSLRTSLGSATMTAPDEIVITHIAGKFFLKKRSP